jgi:NAD-dependent SIR2 family protein deacetylase
MKIIGLLILFVVASGINVYSQVEKYLAAFTYQISKSITWPTESTDFTIGVIGTSDATPYFKQIAKEKKIGERNISMVQWNSIDEVDQCQVLFVSGDQLLHLSKIVDRLSEKSVLIITESSGTIEKGAGLNFLLVDGRIRYELNKTALSKINLSIPSDLERMAMKVL